jgi:hypothetical protein
MVRCRPPVVNYTPNGRCRAEREFREAQRHPLILDGSVSPTLAETSESGRYVLARSI